MIDYLTPALPIVMPLIRHFEASDICHCDSYIVPGEEHLQATVGWGTAIPLSQHPCKITKLIADRWLERDILSRYTSLCNHVPESVIAKMSLGQRAAFLSWAYNGKGWYECDSFKKLCKGDIQGWLDGAMLWVHGEHGVPLAGLVRRRAAERHLGMRGEIERLESVHDLHWYLDMVPSIENGIKQKRPGHLVWSSDRLVWKLG